MFCMRLRKRDTSKFSLYKSQRLGFITEEASVYCALRTASLKEVKFRP